MKPRGEFQIILASTSPRRIELMERAGFRAEVIRPETEEFRLRGELPRKMVARLAREKADSVRARIEMRPEGAVIISADTVVVEPSGRRVLGKPSDEAEAARMLKLLAGKTHIVLTGYCVLEIRPGKPARQWIRVVSSRVRIRPLRAEMISAYVKSGEPMDKAGSYAAQGMGMNFIEKISGSYTNVVGLPMAQLLMDLERKFGIAVPLGGAH